MNQHILKGMALALFTMAYEDQAESEGVELDSDYELPDIDPAAIEGAKEIYSYYTINFRHTFGVDNVDPLARDKFILALGGMLTLEEFGKRCANQAVDFDAPMLYDSAIDQRLIDCVPTIEFGSHSLEIDYFVEKEKKFDAITESLINGQKEQAFRQFLALSGNERIDYFDHKVSEGSGQRRLLGLFRYMLHSDKFD